MVSKPETGWPFFFRRARLHRARLCVRLARRDSGSVNTRLAVKEIDGILGDANPRGLIRHSSLRSAVQVSWQLVLDQSPLEIRSDSVPDPIYDPDAILCSHLYQRTNWPA